MNIVIADSAEDAAAYAAEWLRRRIVSAVRLRGVCRLAVSGGSSPVPMFDEMAEFDLPWADIHIFQVDERVAPDGDPDRNATQLVDHLLDKVSIPKRNIHLMPVTAASMPRATASYATAIGAEPLDIVHLGMGDDGHTASWPPGHPVVEQTAAVATIGPFNGRARMTMTPASVNAARARLVVVEGKSKAVPLADWVLERKELAIGRVRRRNTTLVLDKGAAARLPRD